MKEGSRNGLEDVLQNSCLGLLFVPLASPKLRDNEGDRSQRSLYSYHIEVGSEVW